MTSNIGSHHIQALMQDEEKMRDAVWEELRAAFRPEFLNRIDDTIIFDPLSREDLRGIVEIQLRGLSKLLADKRIDIDVTDLAKDRLVDLGYEPAYGARPLKRAIQRHVSDLLAREMLAGHLEAGDRARIVRSGDGLAMTKVNETSAATA